MTRSRSRVIDAGREPRWSKSGREIFFIEGRDLLAVEVRARKSVLRFLELAHPARRNELIDVCSLNPALSLAFTDGMSGRWLVALSRSPP